MLAIKLVSLQCCSSHHSGLAYLHALPQSSSGEGCIRPNRTSQYIDPSGHQAPLDYYPFRHTVHPHSTHRLCKAFYRTIILLLSIPSQAIKSVDYILLNLQPWRPSPSSPLPVMLCRRSTLLMKLSLSRSAYTIRNHPSPS